MTIPQIRGMYHGDRVRKEVLVMHGFRLPSALDNRPLTFPEFEEKIGQAVFVSATPSIYERAKGNIVEQLVRPTGLVDPTLEIRPAENQVQGAEEEIVRRAKKGERTLIIALTKRMAEDLVRYHPNHLIIRTLFKATPWPFEKAFIDQWTEGDSLSPKHS